MVFDYDSDGSCLPAIRMVQFNYLNAEIIKLHRQEVIRVAEVVKKLPIGIESFEKIRRDGFYYVDKTGLIKELLENCGEAYLFTRPRRFG